MATTVVMPPSNSVALVTKYLPLLDEQYKRFSLTSMFDTANAEFVGANAVKLFTYSSVGMADYDRNAGYVTGDITAAWETFTIGQDRGRSFNVDSMDQDETLNVLLPAVLSEENRLHIIPEVDAYRFAKWASTANIGAASADIVPGTTDVPSLIDAAEASMDNEEVPYEGRILFVSPKCYQGLKEKIERRIINSEDNVNTNVEFYDDMRIIRVPQSRFSTAITLAQPTTAAGDGGYTASGYDINFMIVHPSAILQVMKHKIIRVFSPEQNIEADGYRVNARYYHDTWVKNQKVKGIYCHRAATSA